MQWTRTDRARRWIVVAGLILGPVLLVLSVVINLSSPDSMRAEFEAMTANSGGIVAEAFLETFGFMIVLAAFAGSAQALRSRGGTLGTWGAALSILGIVGFALSNATGFELAAFAQLPDHDAAFETAKSITSGGMTGTIGTVEMILEIAGQVGILLVIGGLIRARITRIWPLLLVIVGIIANAVIGLMVTTIIADLLLLVASSWVAVGLARSTREAWLGEPMTAAAPRVTQGA
jgi:hypothetical protein